MIVINGRWLTFAEVWFAEDPAPRDVCDVLIYRLARRPMPHAACEPFHSLTNDLTQSEDKIFARFGKSNRYKINRAGARDGVTFEFIPEPAAYLDEFCAFYDAFARQKSLPPSYRRGLYASAAGGSLSLARVLRSGESIVWHAYVHTQQSAALLHSASHFREVADEDRAMIARANRWLHWQSMLEFKRQGLERYDWGGLFEDESVPQQASINTFKREFGGEPHCAYTCVQPVTLKGRLYRLAEGMMTR